MRTRSPLLDRAVALLLERINNHTTDRFPPITRLAIEAGVSVYTMAMAVQRMARENKLVVLDGRGIWRPGTQPGKGRNYSLPSTPPPTPRVSKLERVCAHLERDISTGALGPAHPLPSSKELCTRYGLSSKGMRRALDALVSSGLLEKRGRSCRVRSFLPASGQSTIVMLVEAPESATVNARIRFNSRLIDELERQCRRQNLTFVLCPVTHADQGMAGGLEKKLRGIEQQYSVIGYIITGYYLVDPPQTIARVCARRKPVAVIYQSLIRDGDVERFPANAHSFLFDDGRLGGAMVAHHLLQLGHRSMAYMVYEDADGVRPERREEINRIVRQAGGTVVDVRVDAVVQDTMHRQFDAAAQTLTRHLQKEGLFARRDANLQRRVREKLLRSSTGEIFRVSIHTALDRLFAQHHPTALIGGGETTPGFMLEYLQLRKFAVPTKISLVGFGNSLAESEKGITSYDYDCYAVAHAILWNILSPDHTRRAGNRLTVVEGMLIARTSTGAVPS